MPVPLHPHAVRVHRLAALSFSLGMLLTAPGAFASDREAAQRLWLSGQRAQAVALVESALLKTPEDAHLRFALGVMRMELGESAAAKGIFTQLTLDFPDLPDPFNNLAVLHAAQGELDESLKALQQALRLQPEHAQAQENLGDLMLRLAQRAYQRAVSAAPAPAAGVALKLSRTRQLIQDLKPAAR